MLFVVNPSAYLIEKVLMYMNDAIKCTKEEKINKRPHDRGNKLVQIQSMIKYHKSPLYYHIEYSKNCQCSFCV